MSITSFSAMTHFITLAKAIDLTTQYRNKNEELLKPLYQQKQILPLSETFNREAIEKLLSQPGCEGIRCYYGMDEDNRLHLVLVGANAQNQDMLPSGGVNIQTENAILENSARCPTDCPELSVLNS